MKEDKLKKENKIKKDGVVNYVAKLITKVTLSSLVVLCQDGVEKAQHPLACRRLHCIII